MWSEFLQHLLDYATENLQVAVILGNSKFWGRIEVDWIVAAAFTQEAAEGAARGHVAGGGAGDGQQAPRDEAGQAQDRQVKPTQGTVKGGGVDNRNRTFTEPPKQSTYSKVT